MVCSIQREKGCVPAATMRLPCDSAISTSAAQATQLRAHLVNIRADLAAHPICDIMNSSFT